jgi:hypothetical protein
MTPGDFPIWCAAVRHAIRMVACRCRALEVPYFPHLFSTGNVQRDSRVLHRLQRDLHAEQLVACWFAEQRGRYEQRVDGTERRKKEQT